MQTLNAHRVCKASLVQMIRTEGFGIADGVSDGDLLARTALESPAGSAAGVRNLMEKSAAARELAASDAVAGLARAVLGAEAHVVRAILFDKTPEANWKVPWHQDVTIAVSAQANVPGYGPWSVKDGVVHVRPPSTVLERILVVRVHLDAGRKTVPFASCHDRIHGAYCPTAKSPLSSNSMNQLSAWRAEAKCSHSSRCCFMLRRLRQCRLTDVWRTLSSRMLNCPVP